MSLKIEIVVSVALAVAVAVSVAAINGLATYKLLHIRDQLIMA